jgi:hypothetical protein
MPGRSRVRVLHQRDVGWGPKRHHRPEKTFHVAAGAVSPQRLNETGSPVDLREATLEPRAGADDRPDHTGGGRGTLKTDPGAAFGGANTGMHDPWMGLLKLFVGVTRVALRASDFADSIAHAVKCGPESPE